MPELTGTGPSSLITFKTQAGNRYAYSRTMNQFLLLHPVLDKLLQLTKEGVDVSNWFASLPNEGTVVDDCGRVSKGQIEYYVGKYRLLADNGYFDQVDQNARLSGTLSAEHVQSLLANVRHVVFEVTDDCNMACEYCAYGKYYSDYDERTGKYLDIGVARNLLTYLLEAWESPLNASHKTPIHIGFYGGEPLLGFGLIREIVDALKHQTTAHNTFSFSMTTNGVLLGKYMDFLVENDFQLLISLDGDETNNAYRILRSGKPAYRATVKSVLALRDKYPDFFIQKVKFNAVLHNRNSVAEVYAFFKDTFEKIPMISGLDTVGIAAGKADEFRTMYRNLHESLTDAANCSSIEADMFLGLPDVWALGNTIYRLSGCSFRDYSELLYGRSQTLIPTGTCLPFSRKLFLSVNGKILPCERVGHQYSLGSVDANGVTLDPADIAEYVNQQRAAIRSTCVKCYRADICNVCILQQDLQTHTSCPFFMDADDYRGYLSDRLSKLEENRDYYSRLLHQSVAIE